MAKPTKAELESLAQSLDLDISNAKNNEERQAMIDEKMKDAEEIINATDNKDFSEGEDGKVYQVDIALKYESESMEEFIERVHKENLGVWVEPPTDKELGVDTDFEEEESKEENAQIPEPELETEQEKLIKYILANRLAIDQAMCRVASMYGEKSDVWKSLFIAKAWLGKSLAQLGTENPYSTKDPIKKASDIPATADVYDNPKEMQKFSLETILDKVLIVREGIRILTDNITKVDLAEVKITDGRLMAIALTNSYINLCEANFELGYQLSLIKKG